MIQFSKVIMGLLVCAMLLSCDKNELQADILAEVGDTQISMDDFKRAYIPILLYSDKKESPSSREEVLNFLVNQALLENEARSLQLDTVQTLDVLRRTAQKTAFTRMLYRDWVKSKLPTPTESELRTAFKQSHTSLLVRHIFVEDESEAQRIHQDLNSGASWDSIAAMTFKESSLAASGGVLGWIKFGEMDADFEKVAYSLEPGERSGPAKTQFGWHIIQVDERSSEIMLTEYDYSLQRSQLLRIIRERHQQRLADSVINDLMKAANLIFHPDIAPKVWTVMQEQVRDILNSEYLQESFVPELNNFQDKLNPILDEEMLRFSETQWTVKDFLEKLPEMNRQLMLTDLKKATAFLVRDELIYQEGLKQGLEKSSEVAGEVKDRENQFLANLYLRYRAGKLAVSDAAIKDFYEKHAVNRYQAPDSILIYELEFDDEDSARQLKLTLSQSADIAMIRSRAKSDKNFRLTNLGWFQGARMDRIEYYHKLVNSPLNTIEGPFKGEDGYVLIVATKRHRQSKPLEEVYETVRLDAQEDRNAKLRLKEVQDLSMKQKIRIDKAKLNRLDFQG